MRPKEPLNHLVDGREQVRRREAERFRGLEIDHQFEFGRRPARQVGVGGFLSLPISTR